MNSLSNSLENYQTNALLNNGSMKVDKHMMSFYQYAFAMAPFITAYNQTGAQNIGQSTSPVFWDSIHTTDDYHTEEILESPKSAIINKNYIKTSNEGSSEHRKIELSDYWFCERYKNCSVEEYNIPPKIYLNDVAVNLNKENKTALGLENELNQIDALMLFSDRLGSQIEKPKNENSDKFSLSKTHLELNLTNKIFNVWKIPKVAFSMISRKDLARARTAECDVVQEEDNDLSDDTFNKRRAAFGDKRDDLFYKTIGRDVRKFLQEEFQQFLGGKSIKEWIKDSTFLRHIKDFYRCIIAPKLSSSTDYTQMICCIATLVSHQGYAPFCSENSEKIHDSLHNFTKMKLIKLCQMPEFQDVFNYYAKEVTKDNFRRFKMNPKGYHYAFDDILKQCKFKL